MAQFVKFALITSGSASVIYLMYKFWKNRNITEIPATNSEVKEVDCIEEFSKDIDVKTCRSEERIERKDNSDPVLKNEVEADGVQQWIDESVEEYYSVNPGPSFYENIKQDVWNSLIDSEVWDDRNPENVKCYVQDYLGSERPLSIQGDSSEPEDSDVPSSELDVDERSDVEKKMEWMCNYYFGITYAEYQALEEERAKNLNNRDEADTERMSISSTPSPVLQQRGTVNISNDLMSEDEDDKVKKKSQKWKKFKKRIINFFKGSKPK